MLPRIGERFLLADRQDEEQSVDEEWPGADRCEVGVLISSSGI